eukprot:CAMPEP_0180672248 /NCGR_PEP_ID=MMETSP1037_2-20121125/65025_1 /TAXON_ID=632150 /ORGANISM="Azadinium spinosum, Strain 3D9" /LENGTH=39 /DNA_ID= /DNA_START= /DNA_END= /DNA_ORIENTATION=
MTADVERSPSLFREQQTRSGAVVLAPPGVQEDPPRGSPP